jgi:transcriptional regulator with XRE-family HTH domain
MEKQILRRLREIRYEKGEKPIMIAQHLNIDESTLYKIESGKIKSWSKYLFSLLEYYKIPVEEFFKEIQPKKMIQAPDMDFKDPPTMNILSTPLSNDVSLIENILKDKEEIIRIEREQKEYWKIKYYRIKEKLINFEILDM